MVEPSPVSRADCSAAVRLDHSKGIPVVPFQERMVRLGLVTPCAAVGPATPVFKQVAPLATPVSTQEASQLAVELITTSVPL